MSRKTIAIDFDGVIHKMSKGYKGDVIYDEPVEGAKEALFALQDMGFDVIVFTARENLEPVSKWIEEKLRIVNLKVVNRKPQAIVYIDDRGLRFTSWPDALKQLQEILEQ